MTSVRVVETVIAAAMFVAYVALWRRKRARDLRATALVTRGIYGLVRNRTPRYLPGIY